MRFRAANKTHHPARGGDKELRISWRNVLTCQLIGLPICSILSVASPALAQEVVGSIIEVEGAAQLERGGQILNAALKMAVQMHDKLKTTQDARLTITLPPGSAEAAARITVYPLSAIDFQTNDTHNRVVINQLAGNLKSELSPANIGYEVRTFNVIATAANGAMFDTAVIVGKSCPDSPPCLRYTDVGVHKGTVQVSNPTNAQKASVEVSRGQETAVACEEPPTAARPLGMRELGMSAYH